jgi:hypothetical protein
MFNFVKNRIAAGRASGKSADFITDEIQGYLQGIKRISPLTEELNADQPAQFFINEKPTGLGDLFSTSRGKTTGKQAYYLKTNDPTAIKFGSVARLGYESAEEAFADGYDAVFTKAGKISINPKSQVISKTPDLALRNKFFLDLETGSITPEAVITGADLVKGSGDFGRTPSGIRIGKKEFKQADSYSTNLADSALQISTRFMWAKGLEDTAFKNRLISWDDFALLDRAKSLPGNYTNSDLVKIRLADGTEVSFANIVNLPEYVNRLKLEWLQQTLGKEVKGYDLRTLGNATNTSSKWLEDAIASNFATSRQLLQESQDLSKYFEPKTLQMEWDAKAKQAIFAGAPVGPNYMSGMMLGHQYQLMTRLRVNHNASDAVLGEDAERFLDAPRPIQNVSERGAGATTFGASNADYGRRAELFVQDTGKQTALVAQKWRDETINSLAPQINAVRDHLESAAELGVLTTALRRDARKYYLVSDELESGTVARLVDREAVKLVEGGKADSYDDAIEMLQQNAGSEKIRGGYNIKNQQVADFLESSRDANSARVQKQTVLMKCHRNWTGIGWARHLCPSCGYAPLSVLCIRCEERATW